MSKVTIHGESVVVTSSRKMEELETIKKYRPNALTLYKGEGDAREPAFKISIGAAGNGSIDGFGAVFTGTARDGSGCANLTMFLKNVPADADIKGFVADKFGGALAKLNELEATLPAVLQEIAADRALIMATIEAI